LLSGKKRKADLFIKLSILLLFESDKIKKMLLALSPWFRLETLRNKILLEEKQGGCVVWPARIIGFVCVL
jgi:hypothetical protein